MTVTRSMHEEFGAAFESVGDLSTPAHYGRPERAHRAVRNGVGVCEMAYGVVSVSGDDRVEYVDDVVTNRVPDADGEGCYALLLDPQGKIRTDLYVYDAGDRLLVFAPPATAGEVAAEWSDRVFVRDVDVDLATGEFGVFGVHGPQATEKVATVLGGAATPEAPLSFVRGRMHDHGVTVIRTDAPAGEEGYEVVCGADAADDVFDTLVNRGMAAVPFGRRTWNTLALEAGTPLFESELRDRIPNVAGVHNALDFEKGCYVGQEVVSRVENRGRPSRRLVGLDVERAPEAGAPVLAGEETVGEVTRAAESPSLDAPIALAYVDFEVADVDAVEGGDEDARIAAGLAGLPFVEGSDRSARLPTYPS